MKRIKYNKTGFNSVKSVDGVLAINGKKNKRKMCSVS